MSCLLEVGPASSSESAELLGMVNFFLVDLEPAFSAGAASLLPLPIGAGFGASFFPKTVWVMAADLLLLSSAESSESVSPFGGASKSSSPSSSDSILFLFVRLAFETNSFFGLEFVAAGSFTYFGGMFSEVKA